MESRPSWVEPPALRCAIHESHRNNKEMVPLFIPPVNGRAFGDVRDRYSRMESTCAFHLPFCAYGDTMAHYGANTPKTVAEVS